MNLSKKGSVIMKKLVFIALSSFLAVGAQAASLNATEIMCHGSVKSNNGLTPDSQVSVIVQQEFLSGDFRMSVAVDGKLIINAEVVEQGQAPSMGQGSIDGYRSKHASITISRPTMDYESTKYALYLGERNVGGLNLKCKEY
jgi:hypothetical protein